MKLSPKQKLLKIAGADQSEDQSWSEQVGQIKAKVVGEIVPHLDPKEGESKDDLKTRLLRASNSKLVRLHRNVSRLKDDFGGNKDQLIDAVYKTEEHRGEGFRNQLKRKSIATLLALHDAAAKRARKAAKAGA